MHNHNRISFVFVPLTKNQVAIIDAEDADKVLPYRWCLRNKYAGRYLRKGEPGYAKPETHVYMHRVILACGDGQQPDHINRNPLDNRKDNLRCATPSQNCASRKRISATNTSGYRGVSRNGGKWIAYIGHQGERKNLGRFESPKEAARAYDEAAISLFGEFATLNFPEAD